MYVVCMVLYRIRKNVITLEIRHCRGEIVVQNDGNRLFDKVDRSIILCIGNVSMIRWGEKVVKSVRFF